MTTPNNKNSILNNFTKKLSLLDDSDSENEGQLISSNVTTQKSLPTPSVTTNKYKDTKSFTKSSIHNIPDSSSPVSIPTKVSPFTTPITVGTTIYHQPLVIPTSNVSLPIAPTTIQERARLLNELSSLYQRAAALELVLNTSSPSITTTSLSPNNLFEATNRSPVPNNNNIVSSSSTTTTIPITNNTIPLSYNTESSIMDKPMIEATINLDHTILMLQSTLQRVRNTFQTSSSPTSSSSSNTNILKSITTDNDTKVLDTTKYTTSSNSNNLQSIPKLSMQVQSKYSSLPSSSKLTNISSVTSTTISTPTKSVTKDIRLSNANINTSTPYTTTSVNNSLLLSTPSIESRYEWKSIDYNNQQPNDNTSYSNTNTNIMNKLDYPIEELKTIVQQLSDDNDIEE